MMDVWIRNGRSFFCGHAGFRIHLQQDRQRCVHDDVHNSQPKGYVHIAIHHRAYAVPFDQPLRGEVKNFAG